RAYGWRWTSGCVRVFPSIPPTPQRRMRAAVRRARPRYARSPGPLWQEVGNDGLWLLHRSPSEHWTLSILALEEKDIPGLALSRPSSARGNRNPVWMPEPIRSYETARVARGSLVLLARGVLDRRLRRNLLLYMAGGMAKGKARDRR